MTREGKNKGFFVVVTALKPVGRTRALFKDSLRVESHLERKGVERKGEEVGRLHFLNKDRWCLWFLS